MYGSKYSGGTLICSFYTGGSTEDKTRVLADAVITGHQLVHKSEDSL